MLRTLPIALLSCCILSAIAQQPQRPLNPDLIASKWPASWITSPTASPKAPGVFYFRRQITLNTVPAHYWVHLSADNRFVLHVNGSYVAEGPARGDLFHWRFETIDLAPFLHRGENLLATVVWNFGESAPVAQMSSRTSFLMQGDTPSESAVNTGPTSTNQGWRVREEPGRVSLGHNGARGYHAAGPAEEIDGRILDWNWDRPTDDTPGWETPRIIGQAATREAQDADNNWELIQDPLPPMEHRPITSGTSSQLEPWYNMLRLGLTTWAEKPEPTRSDCHAWSASPNYDLLTIVAGIHPASPGFKSVRIEPHLQGLHYLDASMPHASGIIHSVFQLDGAHWKATVTLPPGLDGELVWKDRTYPLHSGEQTLSLP